MADIGFWNGAQQEERFIVDAALPPVTRYAAEIFIRRWERSSRCQKPDRKQRRVLLHAQFQFPYLHPHSVPCGLIKKERGENRPNYMFPITHRLALISKAHEWWRLKGLHQVVSWGDPDYACGMPAHTCPLPPFGPAATEFLQSCLQFSSCSLWSRSREGQKTCRCRRFTPLKKPAGREKGGGRSGDSPLPPYLLLQYCLLPLHLSCFK